MEKEKQNTVAEAAERMGWSYCTTLRHFEKVDGTIIKPGLKKRGRTRRKFTIPESVFLQEKQKLSTRTSIVDEADERMLELRISKKAA